LQKKLHTPSQFESLFIAYYIAPQQLASSAKQTQHISPMRKCIVILAPTRINEHCSGSFTCSYNDQSVVYVNFAVSYATLKT